MCSSRRRGDVVTTAHVGDADWFVQQGVAAGVILGGFVVSGGLEQISGNDESPRGPEDPNEACPMCEGTGKTECACARWSDDGEGCASCGYTGIRICPACRGGGRAVRITVEIPVESDEVSARGVDSSGFIASAANIGPNTGALDNVYAFATSLATPFPTDGIRGESSSPSSSFRSLDDDESSRGSNLDRESLLRLLGQMPLSSGGIKLRSSFADLIDIENANANIFHEDQNGDISRDESTGAARTHAYAVVAEPQSSSGGGGGGGGGGAGGPGGENEKNTDPASSKDDEFYAQSGEAIRTLREDYPLLLQKPLVTSIYRDDIGLIDETASFGHYEGHVIASGMVEYKRCHKWLRTAARILFSQSDVQVQRIWSPLGSSGLRTIKVRWSITGKLRLVGNLTEEAHFDGISEYRLDRGGFIYQHTLTDLDWDVAQMKERISALSNVLVSNKQPQLGSGQWFKGIVPEGWFRGT